MESPQAPINLQGLSLPFIIQLRNHLRGVLSILDLQLARYNYKCHHCFYTKYLVNECKCGDKA